MQRECLAVCVFNTNRLVFKETIHHFTDLIGFVQTADFMFIAVAERADGCQRIIVNVWPVFLEYIPIHDVSHILNTRTEGVSAVIGHREVYGVLLDGIHLTTHC